MQIPTSEWPAQRIADSDYVKQRMQQSLRADPTRWRSADFLEADDVSLTVNGVIHESRRLVNDPVKAGCWASAGIARRHHPGRRRLCTRSRRTSSAISHLLVALVAQARPYQQWPSSAQISCMTIVMHQRGLCSQR